MHHYNRAHVGVVLDPLRKMRYLVNKDDVRLHLTEDIVEPLAFGIVANRLTSHQFGALKRIFERRRERLGIPAVDAIRQVTGMAALSQAACVMEYDLLNAPVMSSEVIDE